MNEIKAVFSNSKQTTFNQLDDATYNLDILAKFRKFDKISIRI